MADTARSTDYLLNASTGTLKDNTTGDITPQRLRDMVISAYQPQALNGFRLTLTTATPVTTADVTGATTIYWTPYVHNCIGLYDGTSWQQWTSAELSLALGTLTSGTNYDVFLYSNAGTLTLILGPVWTSDTARGTGAGTTELTMQDGVWVNKVSISGGPGAKAGRYLGTLRTTSTTTTESSAGGTTTQAGGKRFVWNANNRVLRHLAVFDSTDSWSYAISAFRQANGASGNKVEFVLGLNDDFVQAHAVHSVSVPANGEFSTGIGLDSSTVNSARTLWPAYNGNGQSVQLGLLAEYIGFVGIGYHDLRWLENRYAGTGIFVGDDGLSGPQTGLQAFLRG